MPEILKVRLNEIRTFTSLPERGDLLSIRQGMFCGPRDTRVFYSRIEERNHLGEPVPKIKIVVDARPTIMIPPEDDPNGAYYRIEIEDNANAVPCLLSIDLGNSRTMVSVIDCYREKDFNGGLDFQPISLHWRDKSEEACFRSIVSLVNPELAVDGFRLSFMKAGRLALENAAIKDLRCYPSPKKHYWDHDPIRGEILARKGDISEPLSSLLAQRMSNGAPLSRSDLLGGLIVEIYEQAMSFLSSPEFVPANRPTDPRYVEKIHLTYPATLNDEEIEEYRKTAQTGLNAYLSLFKEHPQVEVLSQIDEASAVLALYACSEIRKYKSPAFWLQANGLKGPLGYTARLAAIDLGGGTADLSIVEICLETARNGANQISLRLLARYGVNRCGEALLQALLQECLIKKFFISQITAGVSYEEVKAIYNSAIQDKKGQQFFNHCWRGLALAFLPQIEDSRPVFSYDIPLAFKLALMQVFGRTLCPSDTVEFPLDQEIKEIYATIAARTFRESARIFARFAAAYGVQRLVFAGKTSELKSVRDIFSRELPLPPDCLETITNYSAGPWLNKYAVIRDPKAATVIGGAIPCLNDGNIGLAFRSFAQDREYRWSQVTRSNPDCFGEDLFKNRFEARIILQNPSDECLLSRKLPYAFTQTPVLSYQVRFKEKYRNYRASETEVTLALSPDRRRITVKDAKGTFATSQPIKPEDLEIRICSMLSDTEFDGPIGIR